MKNRDYKHFAPGQYYHIYNRGNGKQDIFLDKEDFGLFVLRLRENLFPQEQKSPLCLSRGDSSAASVERYHRKLLPAGAFFLISYCLMPNHFHLLIRQNTGVSLSLLLQKVCTSYSWCFNKRYDHIGHLFQGAFKAINIDSDSYLLWLSAYIHSNPAVAGLVKCPEDWQYSSYSDYIGKRQGTLCEKSVILDQFKAPAEYQRFVEDNWPLIREKKDLKDLLLD